MQAMNHIMATACRTFFRNLIFIITTNSEAASVNITTAGCAENLFSFALEKKQRRNRRKQACSMGPAGSFEQQSAPAISFDEWQHERSSRPEGDVVRRIAPISRAQAQLPLNQSSTKKLRILEDAFAKWLPAFPNLQQAISKNDTRIFLRLCTLLHLNLRENRNFRTLLRNAHISLEGRIKKI